MKRCMAPVLVLIGLIATGVDAVGADAAKKPAMPAWRKDMKAGAFSPIPGSSPSAYDLDPGYFEQRVFEDWCGLQSDEKHGVLYSALGGGHSTQEQNGVYKCNLMVDKPAWEIVRKSTRFQTGQNGGNLYFPDGRPVARHTYYDGSYVEVGGKGLIVFIEAMAATPFSGNNPNVDAFRFETGDYDLKGEGWPRYPGVSDCANCVAKDPRTGHIWVADLKAGIHHLDPATKTWTSVCPSNGWGFNGWGINYCGSIIDAKRDRFVLSGTHSLKTGPAFGMWNIGANKYEDKLLSGPGLPPAEEEWRCYSGLVHDTINDRYLWLNCKTGNVRAVNPDTLECTLVTKTELPANGVYTRFAFIEPLGGCIYLPKFAGPVLFMPVK